MMKSNRVFTLVNAVILLVLVSFLLVFKSCVAILCVELYKLIQTVYISKKVEAIQNVASTKIKMSGDHNSEPREVSDSRKCQENAPVVETTVNAQIAREFHTNRYVNDNDANNPRHTAENNLANEKPEKANEASVNGTVSSQITEDIIHDDTDSENGCNESSLFENETHGQIDGKGCTYNWECDTGQDVVVESIPEIQKTSHSAECKVHESKADDKREKYKRKSKKHNLRKVHCIRRVSVHKRTRKRTKILYLKANKYCRKRPLCGWSLFYRHQQLRRDSSHRYMSDVCIPAPLLKVDPGEKIVENKYGGNKLSHSWVFDDTKSANLNTQFSVRVCPVYATSPPTQSSMRFELDRFATFGNYCAGGNRIKLAGNGFYHPRLCGPLTICHFCRVQCSNWRDESDVEEEHRRLSCECPLVCNQSDNVPIASDNQRGFRVQAVADVASVLDEGPVVDVASRVVSLHSRRGEPVSTHPSNDQIHIDVAPRIPAPLLE